MAKRRDERNAPEKAGQDFRHSDGARSRRFTPLRRLPRSGGGPLKLTMQMTLDGMVRAMRMRTHQLAEDVDDMRRNRAKRNETTLALLSDEARRHALEAGDEFGR